MSCCEQRNEGLGLKRFTSVGDCGAVFKGRLEQTKLPRGRCAQFLGKETLVSQGLTFDSHSGPFSFNTLKFLVRLAQFCDVTRLKSYGWATIKIRHLASVLSSGTFSNLFPKAQYSPKALYSMVFGPKSLQI